MSKPRIVIADTDKSYIFPLQQKFIEEYFEKADMEIITEEVFFYQLFSSPQRIDVLVVSEELYCAELQRHNIGSIFIMSEHEITSNENEVNVYSLYKYTSVKEIFNAIISRSDTLSRCNASYQKESQIVLVCSATGGAGKTTVALGICASLSKNYKRVLYINASRLQYFQTLLTNTTPINNSEIYRKLAIARENAYQDIKQTIRTEGFSYVPPFRAAIMSLGIDYYIYEKIALSAKQSGDFDVIVIDADTTFDEDKTRLIDIADKIIIVARQTKTSAYATHLLVSNINGIDGDKFVFVCNDFNEDDANELTSSNIIDTIKVSDYIRHISGYDQLKLVDLARNNDIQKIAFLII